MKIRREHWTQSHSNVACHQVTLLTWKAYEGTSSPHASALHWNPPGFRKKKKVSMFFNRVVYQSTAKSYSKTQEYQRELSEVENNKCTRIPNIDGLLQTLRFPWN